MAVIVHDPESIGKLAHQAWWLLTLEAEDAQRPQLDYDEVMETFHALHLGEVAAFSINYQDGFFLRGFQPGFIKWFERPGPQYRVEPQSVSALIDEIEGARNNATTEKGIVFLPARYAQVISEILRYAYRAFARMDLAASEEQPAA
jgi:hypothetical protein